LVLVAALPLVLGACDWSQIGFDAANTNDNPSEPALTSAPVKTLTPAWSTQDADTQVVTAGGSVFTHRTVGASPAPDIAHAFDIATGAVKWTGSVAHASVPVAVGNGLVYYSRGSGGTAALDAATGAPRWGRPEVALALDGTRLFGVSALDTGSGASALLRAIDPNGEPLWTTTTAGEVTGAVVQGGRLVVMTYIRLDQAPKGLVLVSTYEEETGTLVRRVAVAAKNASGAVNPPATTRLAAGGDLVYFRTQDGNDLFAADPETGAVAWHFSRAGINGFAVTPSAVVVLSAGVGAAQVAALDPTSGASKWTANPAGIVDDHPTVAGNLVFVGHAQSNPTVGLLVYDLTNGSLVTSSTTASFGPTPANGHVFVSGPNGLQALAPA
jgi:outer membrane protein assembly factor BamB